MRYSLGYVIKRFGLLVLIIWSGATLNFFIPKMTPRNPLREKLLAEASRSGYVAPDFEKMVQAYEVKFGLDQPLWRQYLTYMGDLMRGDLGVSISNYPKTVWQLISEGIWWTVALLLTTTLLAFLIGSLLGALMAWPKASVIFKHILPSLMIFGAVPAYLVALILIYFLAVKMNWLPDQGGYGFSTIANWSSFSFWLEVLEYSILPSLALILTGAGGWAMGMRGMMVTVQGEDYMTFAEAKGLKDWRLFYKYGVRNALLPQVTGLALALSFLVSGSVLVELVMRYPGLGTLLAQAIYQLDYYVVYGIIFVIICGIAIAMFIMDLIYPLLDPRISYEGS